jgi:hypothetical protein
MMYALLFALVSGTTALVGKSLTVNETRVTIKMSVCRLDLNALRRYPTLSVAAKANSLSSIEIFSPYSSDEAFFSGISKDAA